MPINIEGGKLRHDGKDTTYCHWPIGAGPQSLCLTLDQKDADRVRKWRAGYAKDQEELITYQKQSASEGDKELAKFFKEEARHNLKLTRACTLILDQIEGTSDIPTKHWPVDLVWELDWISSRVSVQ